MLTLKGMSMEKCQNANRTKRVVVHLTVTVPTCGQGCCTCMQADMHPCSSAAADSRTHQPTHQPIHNVHTTSRRQHQRTLAHRTLDIAHDLTVGVIEKLDAHLCDLCQGVSQVQRVRTNDGRHCCRLATPHLAARAGTAHNTHNLRNLAG